MSIEAVTQSAEFFGDPDNYGPITLLPNGGVALVCVDPRERLGMEYTRGMVLAQTAGGLAGRAMDISLCAGAERELVVPIDNGMRFARDWYPKDDARVHPTCKNNLAVVAILSEMADPSGRTLDTMREWAHQLDHPLESSDTGRVRQAAGALAKYLGNTTIEYLTDPVATSERGVVAPLYQVVGQNTSGVYVASLAPGVGLHHSNKPQGADLQGYVDTVAHSVNRAHGPSTEVWLGRTQRQLLGTISLARAAATRTVLTEGHKDDVHYFRVVPGKGAGDQVRVEPVAA